MRRWPHTGGCFVSVCFAAPLLPTTLEKSVYSFARESQEEVDTRPLLEFLVSFLPLVNDRRQLPWRNGIADAVHVRKARADLVERGRWGYASQRARPFDNTPAGYREKG